MKKALIIFVKVAFSTVLFYFVFKRTNLSLLFARISEINPWLIAGAFALVLIGIVLSGYKWSLILGDLTGMDISRSRIIRYYWIGKFYSSVLPIGIGGGDVFRFFFLKKEGISNRLAFISILIDRVTGVLCIFLIVSLLLLNSIFSLFAIFGLVLSTIALCILYFYQDQIVLLFFRLQLPVRLSWFNTRRVLYNTLALIFQLIVLLFLFLLSCAVHFIPTCASLAVMQGADLASVIPLTYQGLGLREFLYVTLIPNSVQHVEQLVLIGLILFLLNIIGSVPGFVFYIFNKSAPATDLQSGSSL